MRFASTRCRTPWKNRLRVETTRNRLTQELPFISGCSHFTRRNTMFRAMQHSCSHYTAFCSNTCTFMQPLQYDLHPHVAEHHGRTDCASKRPATASHRSCPSSPAAATLREETQCFVPCNIHAAITLRFAATRAHSCSHYNAICIDTLQNAMEELITRRNGPQPPHTGAALNRRLQPLYREKHKVCCSGFLPKATPCNIHASLQCVLQHHVANLHVSTHMATEHENIMRPLHCDLHPLPLVTTSSVTILRHHPSSSLSHLFPQSPLPLITSFLSHHPSSCSHYTAICSHFP